MLAFKQTIKIDQYNDNDHEVKKISGLNDVIYKFEEDYIIFKIKKNTEKNIKIIKNFLNLYDIEYIHIENKKIKIIEL